MIHFILSNIEITNQTKRLTCVFVSCLARYFALVSCTLVLWAELSRHPFKSAAYDFVEEFTTLTEVALLLNGIVVFSRKNDGSLEWLEPVVWVFLGASFLLVIAITLIDLGVHLCLQWVSKVRAAKHVLLSPAIFDLQMSQYLLVRFVEKAGPDELRALQVVEGCIARLIQKGLFVHSAANKYLKLAPTALDYVIKEGGGTNPHTANGLLDPHFISKVMTNGSSPPSGGNDFGLEPGVPSRDSNDELLHGSHVAHFDDAKVCTKWLPSAFLFNDLLFGSVLSFCDQKATPHEIQNFATFIEAVQKFEAHERSGMRNHSLLETVQRTINELGLFKHVHAKNKLLASVFAQQENGKKKQADFKVCLERAINPPCPGNALVSISILTRLFHKTQCLSQVSLESADFSSTTTGEEIKRSSSRSSFRFSFRSSSETGVPTKEATASSENSPQEHSEPAYPVPKGPSGLINTLSLVIRPPKSA